MTRKRYPRFATRLPLLCVLVLAFVPSASAEWKEKVLYSFQGGAIDGALPAGGVVFDTAGNLYGATQQGFGLCPPIDCGSVFQLSPPLEKGGPWTETVLHVFTGNGDGDGNVPVGGLIIDDSGDLYGTTGNGGTGDCVVLGTKVGCGIVYEMTPPQIKGGAWTETVLYSFQGGKDGYLPVGNLTFDKAGNLYGATEYGGGYGSCNSPYYQYCGTIFKLSPPKTKAGKWKETVLYSFKSGTDGANPNGGLVFDAKGAIYGTTYAGGNDTYCKYDTSQGCGTAFELRPPDIKDKAWKKAVLRRFSKDEGNPSAGMIFDGRGYLYGTTLSTVFRLTPLSGDSGSWKHTILFAFCGQNEGCAPAGSLIFDSSGRLYGTTFYGFGDELYGSVFCLKPPRKNEGLWAIDCECAGRSLPSGRAGFQ